MKNGARVTAYAEVLIEAMATKAPHSRADIDEARMELKQTAEELGIHEAVAAFVALDAMFRDLAGMKELLQ